MKKAIAWAEKRPVQKVMAKAEGYEDPKAYLNQRTNKPVQPDISFVGMRGEKHYTEIVLKGDDPQEMVTKWKLLSLMATIKNGRLHLLAPKGHKMFAERLVRKYNINAQIYSI